MKSFKRVLYSRIVIVTSVAIFVLVAGNLAFLSSAYQEVIGISSDWLVSTQKQMLVEQIKLAQEEIHEYFEEPSLQLALVARTAQSMAALAGPGDSTNADAQEQGLLERLKYNPDGNWVQTDPGGTEVITIPGALLTPDHSIQPAVIAHIQKYAPAFAMFDSLMHTGEEKQWAYLVGPVGQSYTRMTPFNDIAAQMRRLYPGANESDFWQFFFPGIADAWQTRPADFSVLNDEHRGATFTLPYEDAAGSGITISVLQPLYTNDNQFDGAAGLDLNIKDVVDVLQSTKVGERGFALLVRENGQVLALDQAVSARLGLSHGKTTELAADQPLRIMEANLLESTRYDFRELLQATAPDNQFQPLACLDTCDAPLQVLKSTLPPIWEYDGKGVNHSSYRLLFFVPDDEFSTFMGEIRAAFNQQGIQLVVFQVVFALVFLGVLISALLFSLRYLIDALTNIQRASSRLVERREDVHLDLPAYREFADVTRAFNDMASHIRQETTQLEDEIRKRTEALEQETRKATQASAAKSDFLANMSHEIRTPMNAVLGLAYLLTRQELPEQARKLARKIQSSGQSLLGIINDILDVSKIESGKLDIEQAPFRLSQVLDNLATIMAGNAQDKAIELIIIPPRCSEWSLRGDSMRLGQILINLTNNAIKFTDAGRVEVRIEVLSSSAAAVRLRFAVHDTGIGIDSATQARLFQPFAQADASTQRRFGGTGLGLTIVRRLVELMGGTMGLESAPGQGSTFWFELPFEVLASEPHSDRTPLPMQVLIVAKQPQRREALTEIVAALGWSARLASSDDEALDRVRHERLWQGPEAAILLAPSDGDGLSTARAIRATLPEAQWPILLVLSSRRVDDHQATAAVDAVLTRPLTPSPLYDAVVLARHRRLGLPITPTQSAPHAQRLAGLHLLVVDDNEVNREVARGIFADEGAQVSLACDGQEALDWLMAHASEVNLVLMDVQMPVMDGLEATRAIRQLPDLAALPVIALTAGAMPEQQSSAREAGVDGFLSKPFDVEEAVALIGSLTGCGVDALPGATDPKIGEQSINLDYPGLNLQQALAVWKDPGRYRQYLRKFAEEQAKTVAQIRSSEPDAGKRLAHAIKGAAANLGLNDVATAANELERLFLTEAAPEPITNAIKALQAALQIALDSIARYVEQTPNPPPAAAAQHDRPNATLSPARIAELMRATHQAFADFEPTLAEAPVAELAGALSAGQLAPLRQAIENFDASGGAAATSALAEELGITLGDGS